VVGSVTFATFSAGFRLLVKVQTMTSFGLTVKERSVLAV